MILQRIDMGVKNDRYFHFVRISPRWKVASVRNRLALDIFDGYKLILHLAKELNAYPAHQLLAKS